MARGATKFPTQVFVKWEEMDNDPYLSIARTAEEHLDLSGASAIATYELKEVRRGALVPKFEGANAARRKRT